MIPIKYYVEHKGSSNDSDISYIPTLFYSHKCIQVFYSLHIQIWNNEVIVRVLPLAFILEGHDHRLTQNMPAVAFVINTI